MRSETIGKLAAALAQAQGEIEDAVRDSDNPFFGSSYADLSSVWRACRKSLCAHELAVIQTTETTEVGLVLRTTLTHSSGEWCSGLYPIHPMRQRKRDDGGGWENSDDPQSMGSAVTYARRYSLAAIVGVAPAGDDDDAEAAMKRLPEERAKQQATCPECGKPGTIITGKAEYGGGFLCFKKRGGCGAKFLDDPRESQVDQATGEVIPPRRLEPIAKGYPKEAPYDHSKEPDPAATPLDPPKEAKEDDRGYYVGAIMRHAKALKLTNAEKKALGDIHLKGAVAEHAPIEAVRALWQQLETFAHDPEAVKQWRSTATS